MPPRTDTEYGAIAIKDEKENGGKSIADEVSSLSDEQVPLMGGDELRKDGKSVSKGLLCGGILVAACLIGWAILAKTGADNTEWDDDNTAPFSTTPDLRITERAEDASPSTIWGEKANEGPLPTNSWYLNLVSHHAAEAPDEATRAYSVPYIVDTAAVGMPGIRVHWPVAQAGTKNIQMVNDFKNSITLGTLDERISQKYEVDQEEDLSQLGVSLRWPGAEEDDAIVDDGKSSMLTHIVRGMPYATMRYFGGVLPSLYSYNAPASKPVIDGSIQMDCGVLKDGIIDDQTTAATVNKEMKLHFINSDFTWIVFFSQPVTIQCGVAEGDIKTTDFQMNVKSLSEEDEPLVVRLALIDQCTTGKADLKQHCVEKEYMDDREGYIELLREGSDFFPTSPVVDFDYPDDSDDDDNTAYINFDWKAQSAQANASDTDNLLMFALSHHQEQLVDSADISPYCLLTFHGKTCLVQASQWSLSEDMSRPQSFTARRPPEASAIPTLGKAIADDIRYKLGDNLFRGAADTYFSGKVLARVARTIIIASELQQLADGGPALQDIYDDVDDESLQDSIKAAASLNLPSHRTISSAVEQLKKCVQVWFEDAEAAYLYDSSWGGLVNCGCTYEGKGDKGICNNTFPDCPALSDVNEDFGNGYYNDHHYHYGYHVYAAAVVAKFDPKWGKEYFSKILLYIRDFANPSEDDEHFTQFRHKDWWLGSSWASGIVSAENSPHGRNEESSSEAISAYEGMALYGQVMMEIMENEGCYEKIEAAKLIRNAGELLTITEVEATNRYWHVWSSDTHDNTYPAAYKKPVVGMLYDTMATFQTWFSPLDVVSMGIQLIPLTPVGEIRDDPEWAKVLYPQYKESCEDAGDKCVDNGWSILETGLHATAGNREEAMKQALAIPDDVFDSEGGRGNSLSNTIWYIATRKDVDSNE